MAKWSIRIFGAVLAVLGLFVIGLWLMLESSVLNSWRASVLERVLTEQLGQQVVISGDVTVDVGTKTRVRVSGVEMPSENIDDLELARLEVLEFDLDTPALMKGRIFLDEILASGLRIQLLRTADNTTSWSSDASLSGRGDTTQGQTDAGETGIPVLDFLKNKTASFGDMQLLVQNEQNGFEFNFVLTSLTFEQLQQTQELRLRGAGEVNGQAIEVRGDFPKSAPFVTSATFGEVTVQFNGEPIPDDAGGGYKGDLDLTVGDLGDLTDVLRLGRPYEGKGRLSASIVRQRNALELTDILLVVDGADFKQLNVEGDIANLFTYEGYDLRVEALLQSEMNMPKKAARFSDVKLTGISAHITSEAGSIEFEELLVRTNLVDQGLADVGPIRLGEIRRTDEDKLAIEAFSIQAGPTNTPVLVASGRMLDVLSLREFDVSGEIRIPATLVLGRLGADVAKAFGTVSASFALDDVNSALRIREFDARTENTEVWSMQSRLALGDASTMRGFEFDLSLGIPDMAHFLKALTLRPVETGDFLLTASVRTSNGELITDIGLSAGASKLTTHLTARTADDRNVFKAQILSDELRLEDLRKATASIVEIVKLGKALPKPDVQPLVLPSNVQPLVLPRDVQPLVLDKTEVKLKDAIDFDQILLETNVDARIEIKRLTGLAGVSKIDSSVTLAEGKADLGPLDIRYGGGHLRARAKMDLQRSPDLLSISGSTGGWNVGRILQSVGVGIGADGIINGRFNLTGRKSSVRGFADTMRGSVSVGMLKGTLDTSLIELAGLGIFPWLFSEELRQRKTNINCLSVPLRINAGRADFTSAVAETNRVQLVAKGSLDWVRDSIAVRAEPRPIGRPLSRSAWPFEVNGKLSDPQFKLIKGGSRSRRADGADQMPTNREPCRPDIFQLQ